MSTLIDIFKNLVVQIATPYSSGTGFFLQEYGLIVTNEHVVRDNKQVVIHGTLLKKQLGDVVFLDQKFDLAFIRIPGQHQLEIVKLSNEDSFEPGMKVLAVGYPFGKHFESKEGEILEIEENSDQIKYILHDAILNAGNSGGPLIGQDGCIVGVNTFIASEENGSGFSLPAKYLERALQEFKTGNGAMASRCFACSKIVFEDQKNKELCEYCGAVLEFASQIIPYESTGVAKTIERLLADAGHDIQLSRSGHLQWKIQQGSAKINISYYDKTGLIIGDAYLCKLPSDNQKPLYEYLLRQNFEIEGLTFSVKGQEIVLSLLINDRYLNTETGEILLKHLFAKADYYDNVLVEKYGAYWNTTEN